MVLLTDKEITPYLNKLDKMIVGLEVIANRLSSMDDRRYKIADKALLSMEDAVSQLEKLLK